MSETAKWAIALLLGLLVQTLTVVWYFATLDARVSQNTNEINQLKSGAAVYLTRVQLEDILGGRDQRLDNIEAGVTRLEQKFDRLLK